jgi:branched-chain amino acid transport system permease protein
VFHFAHALTFVLAAYAAAIAVGAGTGRWVGAIVAVVVAAVFGALCEVGLYHHLRRRGSTGFGMFLASMGLYIAGVNVLELTAGSKPRSMGRFGGGAIDVVGMRVTTVDAVMMASAAVLVGAVVLFERRSRWGRAMVAARSNPVMAMSVGVDIRTVYVASFALGSALLGLAAFYLTAKSSAQPSMGVAPVISGLVAMFLGGIGRTWGAVLGAIVLGLSQNLGGLWLPGHWQVIVSFVILFVVLLARPQGLVASR